MTIEIPSAEEARAQSLLPLVEKLTQLIAERIVIAIKEGYVDTSISPPYPQMRAATIVATNLEKQGYLVNYGSNDCESWFIVKW